MARVDPATARAFQRICDKYERSVDGQLRWMVKQLIEQHDKGDSNDNHNAPQESPANGNPAS